MLKKFDWQGLPGWVILTLASVVGALFGLWLSALTDARTAERAEEKARADCERRIREMRETELADWKAAYKNLKDDQEAKLKKLERIRKR